MPLANLLLCHECQSRVISILILILRIIKNWRESDLASREAGRDWVSRCIVMVHETWVVLLNVTVAKPFYSTYGWSFDFKAKIISAQLPLNKRSDWLNFSFLCFYCKFSSPLPVWSFVGMFRQRWHVQVVAGKRLLGFMTVQPTTRY